MKISKKELSYLYQSNNNKIVCKRLGISQTTLIKYLIHSGIKLKGKGNRNPKASLTLVK